MYGVLCQDHNTLIYVDGLLYKGLFLIFYFFELAVECFHAEIDSLFKRIGCFVAT